MPRVSTVRVTSTTSTLSQPSSSRSRTANVTNVTRVHNARPTMIFIPDLIAVGNGVTGRAVSTSILWRLPYGIHINIVRVNSSHIPVSYISVMQEPSVLRDIRHYEVRGLKANVGFMYRPRIVLDFDSRLNVCKLCKLIDTTDNLYQGMCRTCIQELDTGTCTSCLTSFLMVNGEYIDMTINGNRITIPRDHSCTTTVCIECGTTEWTSYGNVNGHKLAKYVRVANSVQMPQWMRDRLYPAVCTDCRDNAYVTNELHKCIACGEEIYWAYDQNSSGDLCVVDILTKQYLCYDCDRRNSEKCAIFSYSYKPSPIFRLPEKKTTKYVNDSKLYIGMELEVELKRNVLRREFTAYISQLLNEGAQVPFAYVKSDGSLRNGVEIVTDPGDFEWWEKEFPMYLFSKRGKTEHPVLDGIRGSARTAGMHLHLSKSAFKPTDMYNFLMFHKYMRPTIIGMAGRQPNNYCRYTMDTWGRLEIRNYAFNNRDYSRLANNRYLGLNLSPTNTIELRYFKSKADEKFLRESVEFAHSMWNFSRTAPTSIWGPESGILIPQFEIRREAGTAYRDFVNNNSDMYPALAEVLPTVLVA